MKDDEYWANRLYTQAIAAPDVDGANEDEVMAYVKELAERVCLDPDRMEDICQHLFIPVSTEDFQQANELVEVETVK